LINLTDLQMIRQRHRGYDPEMAQGSADPGSPDHRARMGELRLELIESGWTVFHPEPHGDHQWFAAACNLPTGEVSGTARVGGGRTPLEAMESLYRQIAGDTPGSR
jgi:hypothetical protein